MVGVVWVLADPHHPSRVSAFLCSTATPFGATIALAACSGQERYLRMLMASEPVSAGAWANQIGVTVPSNVASLVTPPCGGNGCPRKRDVAGGEDSPRQPHPSCPRSGAWLSAQRPSPMMPPFTGSQLRTWTME